MGIRAQPRTSVNAESGYSQSLERGLAILSAFKPAQPLLGISELARELQLSRSTTHRYVSTLAVLGYLEQDPGTRKYRLGPRVLDLGFSALNSMELREIAAPHLRGLSDQTGYTTNLAILDGTDIVYLERIRSARQGQREIDLNIHIGTRLPAYCTSLGKVLLAYQPPRQLEQLLDEIEFSQRGPNTLMHKSALAAEFECVRKAGLAVSNEELAFGLRSIAAPVRSQSGDVTAAINLAVHRSMVSMQELIAHLGPALKQTATQISARIGYRGAA